MKINVGIVGYGNLGKALEEIILSNKKYNLVAIFSRRNIVSKYNTLIEKYENYINYTEKISIMFLCGGSKSDLETQTSEMLKYFDCINTFDTHSRIKEEFYRLDFLAKSSNHRLIMSCGWDPGIFSIVRVLFKLIGECDPITFWGKGISMGHSDAIRKIDNVIDAIEFTIPNREAVKLARMGKLNRDIPLHFRECFVVANSNYKNQIENDIKNIPNYFLGQPTKVNFVTQNEISKYKDRLLHKGEVIENCKSIGGYKFKMNFSLSMDSNPYFTAKIMLVYSIAIKNLLKKNIIGAFTPIDIPISYMIDDNNLDLYFKMC